MEILQDGQSLLTIRIKGGWLWHIVIQLHLYYLKKNLLLLLLLLLRSVKKMEMTIVVVNAPFHQSWYLSIHHPSRPVLLWIIWEIHWQYWMMGRLVGLCPRLLLLLPPLI